MKQEIKAQWIAALRSGEYQQGPGQLRDGDQMCCLGVLCDLAAKAGIGRWDGNEFETLDGMDVIGADSQLPSEFVRDWAGLEACNPLIDEGDDDANDLRLAMFNDGSVEHDIPPHTFAQIADLIESYL
jgi:hypothetical protein